MRASHHPTRRFLLLPSFIITEMILRDPGLITAVQITRDSQSLGLSWIVHIPVDLQVQKGGNGAAHLETAGLPLLAVPPLLVPVPALDDASSTS